MKFIIAMVLLFALVVVLLATMRSGPRVTHIEHRPEEDDERKDGDDA